MFCEDVFGNGGLGDVGPVKVVHAVRPYGSALQLEVVRLGIEREVPVKCQQLPSCWNAVALPLDFDVVFNFVDQNADPIPSHVLALVVEIEVLVLYFGDVELARVGSGFWR